MLKKVIIIVAVGLALIAAALAYISYKDNQANDKAFAQVDSAASELNLQSLGEVVLDERYGRVGISGGPPTRRFTILTEESTAQVEQALSNQLTTAGFSQSTGSWQRGSGESFILVTIITLEHGEKLPEGAEPGIVPDDMLGVVISVVTQV